MTVGLLLPAGVERAGRGLRRGRRGCYCKSALALIDQTYHSRKWAFTNGLLDKSICWLGWHELQSARDGLRDSLVFSNEYYSQAFLMYVVWYQPNVKHFFCLFDVFPSVVHVFWCGPETIPVWNSMVKCLCSTKSFQCSFDLGSGDLLAI